MKYSQYSQRRKGSSAFYIIIALCLVLIGIAAWFAVARMNNKTANNIKQGTSSIESKIENSFDEYTDDLESYDDYIKDDTVPNTSDNISTPPKNDDQTASAEAEKIKAYTMPVNGEILKDFSTKALQYSATYNDMRIHPAVDIMSHEGTLVSAVTDGRIIEIENSAEYGKTVTIDHGDSLVIKYCGLKNVTVEKDTSVRMGDSIGAIGTIPSECSDQSHLHVEAYKSGEAISILDFFE